MSDPRHPPSGSARAASMACPDDHRLLAYVESTLEPQEREQLDRHLVGCAVCAAIVADVAQQLYPEADQSPGAPLDGPARGASPATPDPVTRVDRYELLEELGAGAMGVVYRARDPGLRRDVAVKLMRPELFAASGGDPLRARFRREAKLLARLSHGNVVPVYDSGESAQGLYIAMEYVAGRSLTDWLQERRPTGAEIVNVFLQVGRGLAAAHEAGLVHRDVKPDNLLVGDDGRARIADFGLAVQTVAPPQAGTTRVDLTRLTQTGALLGTPAYMAPEQLTGRQADARADQYAFCASLFEAIYEEPLHDRERWIDSALGDERQVRRTRPVPDSLRRVLRRGLRSRPAERYATMSRLLAELAPAAQASAWKSRRPRWLWWAAALGGLGLLAGGWFAASRLALPSTKPRPKAQAQAPGDRSREPRLAPHRATGIPPTRPRARRLGSSTHGDAATPPGRRPTPAPELGMRAHSPPTATPRARASAPPPPQPRGQPRPRPATQTPGPAPAPAPRAVVRPAAPSPRPSGDPADARWDAAAKRQQAKRAAGRRQGARCLALLNAADGLDPRGRSSGSMLRARCEMLSGRCARGRRRFRQLMGGVGGYSKAQIKALEDAAAKRYCTGGG